MAGNTFNTGKYVNGILQDASNNIGIGAAPSGTYKLEVTGSAKVSTTLLVSGIATFGSTLSNGTYTYTLPSATGTLALTSALSGYLPLTGGTLTGALNGTSASFTGALNTGGKLTAYNPASATTLLVYGGNSVDPRTNDGAGEIRIGNNASYYGNIAFSNGGSTQLTIDNSYDNAAASMVFRMRTLGTPINALTILGTGAATFSIASGVYTAINITSPNTSVYYKLSPTGGDAYYLGAGVAQTDDFAIYNATRSKNYLTILGGASGGNVGIGVTSPSVPLEVYSSGGGPTLRITSSYTGTGSGNGFHIGTDASPLNVAFVQNENASQVFYANNGSSTFEIMRLYATYTSNTYGTLQVGTNATAKITITGNSAATGDAAITLFGGAGSNGVTGAAFYQLRANDTYAWVFQIDGSNQLATFYNNGSTWSKVGYQSTGGTWTNSDERRKTNIEDLEYGLKEVLQLKPKKFNFKHDTEVGNVKQKDMGFIAQEVLPIMPLAVDSGYDGEQQYYSMNYANLIPTLVKAIQEQQATITSLQDRLTKGGL